MRFETQIANGGPCPNPIRRLCPDSLRRPCSSISTVPWWSSPMPRERSRCRAGLRPLLDRLAERLEGRLAIVSGRAIDDLRGHLDGCAAVLSGSHGAELRYADGRRIPVSAPPGLAGAREEIHRFAAAIGRPAGRGQARRSRAPLPAGARSASARSPTSSRIWPGAAGLRSSAARWWPSSGPPAPTRAPRCAG